LGISNQLTVGTNATLSGGGRVVGDVVVTSGGSVAPGPGANTFSIGGDLDLASGASTLIDLGGTAATQHDLLNVAGALDLGGDLHVTTINGFSPSAGDSFQILRFASAAGQFDHLFLPTLGSGLTWDTSALNTTGQISVAVPEPAAFGLLALAGLSLLRRRR
jgi:MYXO-CTERM domain-containing protein